MSEEKMKLYNPLAFLNAHFGMKIKVHMRRDAQSKHIPEVIEGELIAFDTRSGLMILNTDESHVVLDNRGSRAYIEIPRGK